MADVQLVLTSDERDLLAHLVAEELGDKRVEVRRTYLTDFKHQLQDQEQLLRNILEKLQAPASV
jgi:hypothetical protein